MKIVSVCLTGPFTEGYAYQDNLINKYYSILGHECTIIANNKTYNQGNVETVKTGSKVINNNIKLIRLENRKGIPNKIIEKFRLYSGLYENLELINPDIIFIHGLQFLDINQIIKYKKNNEDVRIIVDNHADFSNSATNFISRNILHKLIWKRCAKSIEKYTEKFYGVLPARVNFLHEMYDIDRRKIELLVMGADTHEIKFNLKEDIKKDICNKYNINYNDFILVTGGKIDKAKTEVLNLLRAVKESKIKGIKLLVFGSIDKHLKEEFDNLINDDRIEYIGWINSDQVYNYFLAADLGVFPGRHSVLWEQAVGSGLPCIFKRWSGTEHIDLGGNCKFLEYGTQEEIFESINEVIYNKGVYEKMRQVSIKKGIEYFSYEEIARRSIEL